MEEKDDIIDSEQENKTPELKQKKKWPWILLVLLLLVCGAGCYAYVNDYLDPYIEDYGIAVPLHHQKEPDAIIDDPKPEVEPETVPVAEREHFDPALMNGTWISGEDNPVYWEFTFEAPEVTTDKEGVTGMIEESDDERFQYKLVILSPEGQTVYYLDKVDDENAILWIPGSNGLYKGHVKLHKGEPVDHTETVDKPSGAGTSSGKKQSNPSIPSTPSTPSTPTTPDTPSTPSNPDPGQDQKGHWEYIQVLVSNAWDEEVLVSAGYWEEVLVSEAWDETISYCLVWGADQKQVYVCNTCGAQYDSGSAVLDHIDAAHGGGGGWHNDYITVGEEYCQQYDSYVKHHDAVYKDEWHDPVYKTVHHDAVYRTEKVWVND